uniref:Uncharacterized protein n=1 Tax=Rousettus aegyptiacus TaxID=9407 RepID=A0A7J8H1Z1_ROUAE|nr:hypothetical protein HJG63_011412 [Rousettus aegyptiacus]
MRTAAVAGISLFQPRGPPAGQMGRLIGTRSWPSAREPWREVSRADLLLKPRHTPHTPSPWRNRGRSEAEREFSSVQSGSPDRTRGLFCEDHTERLPHAFSPNSEVTVSLETPSRAPPPRTRRKVSA